MLLCWSFQSKIKSLVSKKMFEDQEQEDEGRMRGSCCRTVFPAASCCREDAFYCVQLVWREEQECLYEEESVVASLPIKCKIMLSKFKIIDEDQDRQERKPRNKPQPLKLTQLSSFIPDRVLNDNRINKFKRDGFKIFYDLSCNVSNPKSV